MESNQTSVYEAEQISNYLLGISIQNSEKTAYSEAMKLLAIQLSAYEQLLWKNMLKSKWRMACIDAGLALKDPNNNVRRKLFVMLAILEASPHYTQFFLARTFSNFYLFKIVAAGIRAIGRAMIGLLLINTIKRKCN